MTEPTGAIPPTHPAPVDANRRFTQDECMMAMLAHLLAIFTSFIGPLIIWLMKKNDSRFVDAHGRECLNWILTVVAASIVLMGCMIGGMFCLPIIGIGASEGGEAGAAAGGIVFIATMCVFYVGVIGLSIYSLVMQIMGAVAANKGKRFEYHFSVPFLGRPQWPEGS
jgi:uncharacterized Tic20 family protein